MDDNLTGGRPCTSCGAEVPEERTVCPSCSTLQRSAPQLTAPPAPQVPSAAPIPPVPPPGFAGAAGGAPNWTAAPPPPPTPVRRPRSKGPIAVSLVVVIALLAGGAFLLTRPDDATSSDEATKAGATTPEAATVTTKPKAPSIPWTAASDPRSGLSWELPGHKVLSVSDGINMGTGGPAGVSYTVFAPNSDADSMGVDVTIWDPAGGATQATIDELLQSRRDLYPSEYVPYGKALTVAGTPATVVTIDTSGDPTTQMEAVAVVDGALVLINFIADGKRADAAAFEHIVASFQRS